MLGMKYSGIKRYKVLTDMGGVLIPRVFSFSPLTLEYVDGKSVYAYGNVADGQKKVILEKIVQSLKRLHSLGHAPFDAISYREAYIGKTKERLEKVKDLIPFADQKEVLISGRVCRNIFFCWNEVEELILKYAPDRFVFLHGDCTFSNMAIGQDGNPYLFDPRGYFGYTDLYGDAAYDWVKLYYSLASNYDRFNQKDFVLTIHDTGVSLCIGSNHWENMEDKFFRLVGDEISRRQMKVLLAVTWLSLTTYAWEDYDAICGAFYNGLLYLEEALSMQEERAADGYFENTLSVIDDSIRRMDRDTFEKLARDVECVLVSGHKVVVSGLGKNVPVCEKFVGTMLSLGLDANFLHTNSAVHGDMGMVKKGDLVIILSKSANTSESIFLADLLKQRNGVGVWLLCFNDSGRIVEIVGRDHTLMIPMKHEGDPWDIVPNNSTVLNLIVLQGLAMSLAKRLNLSLEKDFKPNHPGGAIGEKLNGI